MFAKAGINRHLKTHLKQKEAENERGKSYLLKVEDCSRNLSDYLEWLCDSCQKLPATQICTAEWDGNMFCDKCAKKHAKTCPDFEDCALPVVNSPRLGICTYAGGWIDTERDGMK
jgi:hypothetical protein